MGKDIKKLIESLPKTENKGKFIRETLGMLTPDFISNFISTIFPDLPLEEQEPASKAGFLSRLEKTGLYIGQNYANTKYQLKGCINDAEDMKLLYKQQFNVNGTIYDDTELPITFNTIKRKLQELARSTHEGVKTVVLTYSGHGSHSTAQGSDVEEDGEDECWIVWGENGYIVGFYDDDLRMHFLDKIADDTNVLIISDCCNFGSGADLNYTYNPKTQKTSFFDTKAKVKGNVIHISGCKDDQVSQEIIKNGMHTGALTYCIVNTLKAGMTPRQLIDAVYGKLVNLKLAQIPLVTMNREYLLDLPL